jgi:hypothetical protein
MPFTTAIGLFFLLIAALAAFGTIHSFKKNTRASIITIPLLLSSGILGLMFLLVGVG